MHDASKPDEPATDVLPGRAPSDLAAYTISVVAGVDTGATLHLNHDAVIVGAAVDADLRLTDTAVSRRHVELTLVADGVAVRDLESTNGTFHLGARVQHIVVGDGARLELGTTTLELVRQRTQDELAPAQVTAYGELLGEGLAMRKLFAVLLRLEQNDVPVLLHADTGTGKELVARALHDCGKRKDAPFVVFDCGAVAPELVESELFGHARGAFTGAQNERAGVFEQAHQGTLLLDEVGELPLAMQTRLLRALERGEVKRVGENGYRKVDVRVIAATHRNLEAACVSGAFRLDLYYRLAVVKLHVPTLAERREDIPLLATHFAKLFGHHGGLPAPVLTRLAGRDWPGNVRELRNVVQRYLALGDEALGADRAPVATPIGDVTGPYKDARERLVDDFEARYVSTLLARHSGNVTAAAREAQISRKHLHELLKKHGLG